MRRTYFTLICGRNPGKCCRTGIPLLLEPPPTGRWEELGQASIFLIVFDAKGGLSVTYMVDK